MKFIKRLICAILFIPALFATTFIQPIGWIFTGRLGEPWAIRLLAWGNK